MSLPIDAVLPELIAALRASGQAVLQAPPGAGKTTRVPLAMLEAGVCPGKIIMLEPRRLATRAAAERLAQGLGETVGMRVGYRMRGDSKISSGTKIEVVTEGVLTRMIQNDPELRGIGAVVFDEFHERSLNADLGLALCLDIRAALRPDLILMVMSATLDAAPIAELMGHAPIVTAQGRSFPVDLVWRDAPLGPKARLAPAVADTVRVAVANTDGGTLVFLPGAREIGDVQTLLNSALDPAVFDIRPLYGALPFAAQRAAIGPAPGKRKVVLATSIAETSLTIEDIRIVVDAGRSRRARFDPGSGMSRLVTERVTRAEATQRAGRAGRVAPGVCHRLWTKGEEGGLAAFPPAEIEAADLTGLALELAAWGATEADLAFPTPPPAGALAEARALLETLAVLDDGRMTHHGTTVAKLPLHPRLGHMLAHVGPQAALPAAIMAGRDPINSRQSDLGLRLRAIQGRDNTPLKGAAEIRAEAKRCAALVNHLPNSDFDLGEMAALAYPDRIGKRRPGDAPRYVLTGGKGAVLDANDALAGQEFIVATDLDGDNRDARVRLAVPIAQSAVRALYQDDIRQQTSCVWSRRDARVIAEIREMLGAVSLSQSRWHDAPAQDVARAMCDGIRHLGLRFSKPAALLRARVLLLAATRDDVPDMTDAALLQSLEDWLLPFLEGITTAAQWKAFDIAPALRAALTWDQAQALDQEVPSHFTTPLNRRTAIDYSGDHPTITLRLQEMFGVTSHPVVAGKPLRITLLSPAQRPVQTTMDIVGFWANSYADVRRDMRGKYPRHPWPEDPSQADPTVRAKPRK